MNNISAGAILCFWAVASFGGDVQAAEAKPPGPEVTTFPADLHPKDFRGVVDFAGSRQAGEADLPHVQGVVLTYYWSQLAKQRGSLDTSRIEHDMAPWIAKTKFAILRVSAAGEASWSKPAGKALPDWLYGEGLPTVTETDGAVIPQYWNPLYLQALDGMVAALAKSYDGNPHVAYIEIGVGDGGETLADTFTKDKDRLGLLEKIGYDDDLWFRTIQKIVGIYKAHFRQTPLALMVDSTFLNGKVSHHGMDEVLKWASGQGLWLQHNGLRRGTRYDPAWYGSVFVAEQRFSAKKNKYPLGDDLVLGIASGARYLLVYKADLENPANAKALEWADQLRTDRAKNPSSS